MSRKQVNYPRVVSRGSSSCKIFRENHQHRHRYVISWYDGSGKRERKRFFDEQKAYEYAQNRVEALNRGESAAKVSLEDQIDLKQAKRILNENNLDLSVSEAATQLAELHRCAFEGAGFSDLVMIIQESPRHQGLEERTIAQLCKELIDDRTQGNYSDVYVKALRNHLNRFRESFRGQITNLKGPAIQQWLKRLGLAPRTEANHRTSLVTLVNYAKSMGYFPDHMDPLKNVEASKPEINEVEIFTPEEMARYLSEAPEQLLPYLVIGAFAGVRTAEIGRLTWNDIDQENIILKKSVTKTGARRLVPLAGNLKAWLKQIRNPDATAKVARHKNISHELSKWFKNRPELPRWKQNALRHSFCSYRLAATKNMAQVSLEAGNSPRIIQNNYMELVTTAEATAWFSIMPDVNSNGPLRAVITKPVDESITGKVVDLQDLQTDDTVSTGSETRAGR